MARLLGLVLAAVLCCAAAGSTSVDETQALVDLYASANGTLWVGATGWPAGDPCDPAWSGVVCISDVVTCVPVLPVAVCVCRALRVGAPPAGWSQRSRAPSPCTTSPLPSAWRALQGVAAAWRWPHRVAPSHVR
jgi:hypothetical protein